MGHGDSASVPAMGREASEYANNVILFYLFLPSRYVFPLFPKRTRKYAMLYDIMVGSKSHGEVATISTIIIRHYF